MSRTGLKKVVLPDGSHFLLHHIDGWMHHLVGEHLVARISMKIREAGRDSDEPMFC